MPSLSFKAQFAEKVTAGTKPHSIRAWRKQPFAEGADLSFFSGMRTKACKRLRPNTPCTAAIPIEVNPFLRYVILSEGSRFYSHGRLPDAQLAALALRDGFESLDAFFDFFRESHNGILCGQLIEWQP